MEEYNMYHDGRLVASLTSLDAYLSTIKLLRSDPADDGPEVEIIRRERAYARHSTVIDKLRQQRESEERRGLRI